MEPALELFFRNVQDDVHDILNEDPDTGGNPAQAFTRVSTDKLADAGETGNVIVAYDERNLGRDGQHIINGYAISDNYETIDLFITIHNNGEIPVRLTTAEINTAEKRIYNFFLKCVGNNYINELDPASQIYQLAHTLNKSQTLKENLVRVNAIIVTNNLVGKYNAKFKVINNLDGWEQGELKFYYRIVDLTYLFNISEKPRVPIELDLEYYGFVVPCVKGPSLENIYESYLAIVPGTLLAKIYEEHGQRLLEQNIRTFLQFSGKINKGIRKSINTEPEMFFAYNNGISATAEEVRVNRGKNGSMVITYIKDLQIVNGGQTTASIFHTWRKDRSDLSEIAVPMKLNIINQKDNYSKIVERIAEYANTQNKVSFSDLTANNPFYVELEKLSRAIVAPHVAGQSVQTHWFFERSRAQYKNQRAKEGTTISKLKSFDARNPKSQLFTKEEIAKYVNTFSLIIKSREGKKYLIVGPNTVVQGSQKNHEAFIKHNLPDSLPDNIWFEDLVAKAILFRTTEKLYGRAPNAIGDLRYITVPYTLAYLNHYLNSSPINWERIWKNQEISENMQVLIKDMLYLIERVIKDKSPGSLYGQFAKEITCWNAVIQSGIAPDISTMLEDLIDPESPPKRNLKKKEIVDATLEAIRISNVQSISNNVWNDILSWNLTAEKISPSQIFAIKCFLDNRDTDYDILNEALDLIAKYAPELLQTAESNDENIEISLSERAAQMITWIKENHHKTPSDWYTFIKQVRDGKISFNVEVQMKLRTLEKWLSDFNYPNPLNSSDA